MQRKLAYPARNQELDDDEDDKPLVRPGSTTVSEEADEDDKPLVQLASREKTLIFFKTQCSYKVTKKKRTSVWQDPSATLEQDVSGSSRERSEDVSSLDKNSDGEALQKITNKLSDVRNFKVYDLYQHVVKTCPFCNSSKPRPDRSRVSGLRAEELGDLIFLDHGSTKIGDQTSGFLIVLDGATSHLTAHPCKSTSPSEVISKLHEWMDTFQVNPKAICADMAFHHPS